METGAVERWVEQQVAAGLRYIAASVTPVVAELATLGVAVCCLAAMLLGNPGRWFRWAGILVGAAVAWMVWFGG